MEHEHISPVVIDNSTFDALSATCQALFDDVIKPNPDGDRIVLFVSDIGDQLYDAYISMLAESDQQYHRCSCCKTFIRRFGSLVYVDDKGDAHSVIWNPDAVPDIYRRSVGAMKALAESADITSMHLSDEKVWGTPVTDPWTHFAIHPPKDMVFKRRGIENAHQTMAQKKQDVIGLRAAASMWTQETLRQGANLLKGEKGFEHAKFLFDLRKTFDTVHGTKRFQNLLWRMTATAAPGWCTPKGSVVGEVMDDIASGAHTDEVIRRYRHKMHPLTHMRAQSPPKLGNILHAEKIVEELGLKQSLLRRFATVDEVKKIWTPRVSPQTERGGVFGGVKARDPKGVIARAVDGAERSVTWRTFAKNVLPDATRIEVNLGFGNMNLGALMTATHADAPPILQWDEEENRNPFSMYVYHGGSLADQWGLRRGSWVDVSGITLHPAIWEDEGRYPNFVPCACLLLEGARDQTANKTLSIFPTTVKQSLHAVRATIEAYSKAGRPDVPDEPLACGLWVGGKPMPHSIRVTTDLGRSLYHIALWE